MKASDLCTKALNIAQQYNTYYLWGTFGAPLTGELITPKAKQYPAYYSAAKREKMAVRAAQGNYWAFDCVGLIKSILWGWNGDRGRAYGGATYAGNGVPDIDANTMIGRCSGVSTDFKGIVPGEVVWMQGHIGIYIGGGKVVESTAAWDSGVQISACGNLGTISGLHARSWTKHGRLPWVDYSAAVTTTTKTEDDDMITQEQFNAMYNNINPLYTSLAQVPSYWQADTKALMETGAIKGDGKTEIAIREGELKAAIIARRCVLAAVEK